MAVLTCPVCQGQMREMNKDGILIDVCTQCRGVWLDRGELEKLAAYMPPMDAYRQPQQVPPPYDAAPRDPRQGAPYDDYRERRRDYDDDDDDHRYRDNRGHYQKSKMSRFLDFFD
jgi:uncharacterized protein